MLRVGKTFRVGEEGANIMSGVSANAQPDRFGFLHIDLNSFFASVEQELHPEYRGKPLGVCGTMADTGALIAASYEAKALGIHTLTKVGEAKRICPEIILVSGSHTMYSEFSHKIAAAVERCCPVAHTPSIDEMVCQLMGREREPPAAQEDCARDQAGDQGRCGRDAAVLDRDGAESLPGEDCERYAEAGWADRAAAVAAAAGDCASGRCGICRGWGRGRRRG